MTNLKVAVVGLSALTVLTGCGDRDEDDPLTACFPESFRDSCVGELSLEFYRTCYDGSGICTFSENRDESGHQMLFEWENGARVDFAVSESGSNAVSTTFQPASGARCTMSTIDSAECNGYNSRFNFSDRWYEVCIERGGTGFEPSTFHFTCDDGSKHSLSGDEMGGDDLRSGPPICEEQLGNPFEDCVDEAGRPLEESPASPTVSSCSPEVCGDIGSRCTVAMPCDQGNVCHSIGDPPGIVGFCALPCEDQSCPAETACTNTLDRESNQTIPLCLRMCSGQADCDPYGSFCMGATDTRTGFCN